MKTTRKLFAMVLAVIMVMSLATTAFAAGGDTYEIYQIFTGDISDGKLVNVKWGENGTGTKGEAVDEAVLEALTAVNGGTDAEKLAVIEQYAKLTTTPHTTGSANTYTLPNGYYLVRHVAGSQESNGAFYTLHVVKVVNGTLTITTKGGAPSVTKTVDKTDINIGDTVTFTLTATMPSTFEGYETYKVIFHDTMHEGLNFNASSIKVFVGDTKVDTGYQLVNPATDGHTFDVAIADVKTIGATAGSTIKVEYTATLNSHAVIGAEGNSNTVKLEYSNNPNPGFENETGVTPDSTVKVYTWDMEVLKYADGDKNSPLKDVKFILLNAEKNKIAQVEGGKIVSWVDFNGDTVIANYELATDAQGKISIDGLASGTYYLRETQELPGYNKLTGDVTVTVNGKTDGNYSTFVAEVNNQSGATLPETGGMGTTVFYILGAVLMLGAAVLLVTKRRMSMAE